MSTGGGKVKIPLPNFTFYIFNFTFPRPLARKMRATRLGRMLAVARWGKGEGKIDLGKKGLYFCPISHESIDWNFCCTLYEIVSHSFIECIYN